MEVRVCGSIVCFLWVLLRVFCLVSLSVVCDWCVRCVCLSARSAVVYMLRVARCRTGCVSPLACNVRPLLRAFAQSSVGYGGSNFVFASSPRTGNADDATERFTRSTRQARISAEPVSHTSGSIRANDLPHRVRHLRCHCDRRQRR